MATKKRKESNMRFTSIGKNAKYTIELNGEEFREIKAALRLYKSVNDSAKKMTQKQYQKFFGGALKEDWRINKISKILDGLEKDIGMDVLEYSLYNLNEY